MRRLPSITPRSGHFLIGLLLLIKLSLLVWNAAVFDGKTYEFDHHADRALFRGLRPAKMAHSPPPYYFPAFLLSRPADVPLVERNSGALGEGQEAAPRKKRATKADKSEASYRARLVDWLRYSNVLWLGTFYVGWICYAFPRLLVGFQSWFLASLLLLAMPGYQKLGVMTHPENMFAGMTSLAVCGWLLLRERWSKAKEQDGAAAEQTPGAGYSFKHLLGFAFVIGLTALTRPFAVVPVAVLACVALVYLLRLVGLRWKPLLPRVLLLVAIIGTMSTSWYAYRWQRSSEITSAFPSGDSAELRKQRANFDYLAYYTSLKLGDLIGDPSRIHGDGSSGGFADTPLGNSFFSLLHSEIWGDQWLYFSGPKMKDYKVWPKRVLLVCALAVPLLVAILAARFAWDLFRRARSKLRDAPGSSLVARLVAVASELERELVLLAIAVLGAALFIYWQAGPALLPGNNSTVKFIYVSTLFPPAIALIFMRPVRSLSFNLLSGYFLVLFAAAFPVAMYWPR